VRTVWIGLAGFFGAASRYHFEGWVSNRWPTAFPWGTFAVNVTGCFLLGFIFTLLTERLLPHPDPGPRSRSGSSAHTRRSPRSRSRPFASARTEPLDSPSPTWSRPWLQGLSRSGSEPSSGGRCEAPG
jgi:CrcB-like protein, Camphor Resistance (CrcB)